MFWKSAMPAASSAPCSAAGRGFNILQQTNLDRFLDSVTPCLPLHSIPPSDIKGISSNWLPVGDEPIPYFRLSDLWQGFDEASAYGIGSRVLFGDGDIVTQYYSPFLSAIQLFTNQPYASASNIPWRYDNEGDKISWSVSNNSIPTRDAQSSGTGEDGSSLSSEKHGFTYLAYSEFASPFWRIPLYEKIMEFAQVRPELMTMTSVELSPSSWLAVVWYPIYSIPSQKRSKDLSTNFLTFHNLSTSSLGGQAIAESHAKGSTSGRKSTQQKKPREAKQDMIHLRPFGLSTLKLSGNTWTKTQADVQKMSSLQSAADSWLKQFRFSHHDFSFYLTQSSEPHK